jgi:hypothetical protein
MQASKATEEIASPADAEFSLVVARDTASSTAYPAAAPPSHHDRRLIAA